MRLTAILSALALASGLSFAAGAAEENPTGEQQALIAKYRALAESLHPQRGDIAVAAANASLHLGNQYYFLPAAEAKRVLVEGWGNPNDAVGNVLGMIFPNGKSFLDDSWAAVITYRADGYVSDADAKTINYDDILKSMQAGELEENVQRKAEGLPSIHLVGWAQPPSYDAAHHALIWARDIRFGEETERTLNYDLRTLGRRGILSMNIVSTMAKLDEVRAAATDLQQVAGFAPGSSYADYRPETDAKASYGLAGLVAAGLGAAAAQKLGLFAIILLFIKKAGVLLLAVGGAAAAGLRRFFGRKTTEEPRDLRQQ